MMTEDDDDYGFLMAMMTRSSANLNFQKSAKAYYRPEDCWVRHQSFVQGQKESSRANDPFSSCLQSFFFFRTQDQRHCPNTQHILFRSAAFQLWRRPLLCLVWRA